jgi:hypothetical protein
MNLPAYDHSPAASSASLETVLRQDLAQGDAFLSTAAPLLCHFLTNDDDSLFSDEIIARVRGLTADLAVQLLEALGEPDAGTGITGGETPASAAMVGSIVNQPTLLRHVHALALEWQLTERLQHRLSLDPVVSPLIQALVASPEPQVGGMAMKLLTAQARFGQNMRRMKLPVSELPGDMFHALLQVMRTTAAAQSIDETKVAEAELKLRKQYDEAFSRLAMAAQLVIGMGPGVLAALSITHAGVALFLSGLAHTSGQDRDVVIHSTNERQVARLALSLSASGIKAQQVEEQILSLHPDILLPEGYDRLDADRAAAILANGPGA